MVNDFSRLVELSDWVRNVRVVVVLVVELLLLLLLHILFIYRKILIISRGLIFVQKVVSAGLIFWGDYFLPGAYYWKKFCVLKWVGLDNKTANTTVHGFIIGRAYYRKDFCL